MSTNRRLVVLTVSGLALVCLAGGALYLATSSQSGATPGGDAQQTSAGSGPLSAATPSAVSTRAGTSAGDNRLEPGPGDVVATDPAPVQDVDGATVVVSYADAGGSGIEVGGYVSGVVEDGGTCRATATRGAQQVVAEVSGIADASTTTCGGLLLAADDLSAGTWSVQLAYETGGTVLESSPVDVQVAQ